MKKILFIISTILSSYSLNAMEHTITIQLRNKLARQAVTAIEREISGVTAVALNSRTLQLQGPISILMPIIKVMCEHDTESNHDEEVTREDIRLGEFISRELDELGKLYGLQKEER